MISVVTPSFRQLDWLRLAIASVSDQQTIDLEHIIQDGGSDGVDLLLAQTVNSLGSSHADAKLFVEKDAGMYDAINRGLRKARGEICAWLNCDEQYLPGALRIVSDFFERHPNIDILFGDVLLVDVRGNALSYRRAIPPSPDHIRLSHLNISSCATFFRRRVLEQGHWLDPSWKSIGDAIWMYGMLKAGLRAAVCPQLMSIFTLTGANLSTDDPVSEQEKERWLAQPDAPARFLRPWSIASHRIRKLLAGAYCKRTFDYDIYTLDSPSRRVRFTVEGVSGTWKRPSTKTNDPDHSKR
jgi:hypothetical protein